MSRPRKSVLVATLGLAPQVLTETVYALATRDQEPFIPEEIHVITTAPGAELAVEALVEGPHLKSLAQDYALAPLLSALTRDRIHVIADHEGQPLADINSAADNAATADSIAALVRVLTADPDTTVFASIAGGRKTMGFLLGYAVSLYGRPQDRLSHVLVDAPLEAHPAFYYPRPVPETLQDRQGQPFLADASRVSLADIPFVRLRDGLPDRLLSGDASYSAAVAVAEERLQPPRLIVDMADGVLTCHGRRIALSAAELAFGALLAQRRRENTAHGGALRWDETSAADFLSLYALTAAPLPRTIETLRQQGIEDEWFAGRVSRLNRALRDALGPLAPLYTLKRTGRRPKTRVGFSLPPDAISIRGVPWFS